MRVGALYAILRLEKGQFETALMSSGGKFAAFAGIIKAGALIAAQAFAGIAAGSLYLAQNFEKHMNASLAIMGEVSASLRKEMETTAREVAKTTTGMMDLEQATELLMDTQTTMGLRSDDAAENMKNMTRVSDVLTAAQVHSNATLQQMAEAMTNKAGPALRLLNKDIEEGAAVLAVMANQGVKGRVAGTNLAIVLRELQTKAIKNKDAFRDLGVAVYDAEGNMRNIADIIEDLEDATAGLSDEQKKQVLLDLGFTDRSVGFIQALLGRSDAIREYEKMLRAAAGTTEEVADKQLDTLNGQLKLMWHRIEDIGIGIGQKMLPGTKDIVKAINDWLDVNDELIVDLSYKIIDGIAGVIKKIRAFGDAVTEFVKPAVTKFQDLMWVLRHLDAYLGQDGVFGALAGLLMPAIEAIESFNEKLEVTFGNLDDVRWALSHLDAYVGQDSFWGKFATLTMPVIEALEDVSYWFGQVMDHLNELDEYAGDETPLGKVADAVLFLEEALRTLVDETIPDVIDALTPLTEEVLYLLGERVRWLTEEMFPALVDLFTTITENVGPKLGEALDFLSEEVFPALGAAVQWFVDNPMKAIQDAMVSFLEWTNEHWPQIQEVIVLVLETIGEAIGLLSEIIATFVTAAWALIQPIIDTLFPDFGDAGEDLLTIFGIVFEGLKLGIKAVRTVFEAELWLIRTAIDGIVWIINRVIDGLNMIISAANAITGTNSPLIPKIGEAVKSWGGFGSKDGGGYTAPPKTPTSSGGAPTGSFTVGGSTTSGSGGVRAMAAGTMNFPGGWTWVGESGPELLKVPTGAQIMSNAMSRMYAERQKGQGLGQISRPVYVTVEGSMKNVETPEDLLDTLQLVDYLERMRRDEPT
jgi:TP901 family phage tail tape measure protein